MNELPKEYPFIHVYQQQKAHQPVIIKGNTEGLCVLLNAILSAIIYDKNEVEVFDGEAEAYEIAVKLVKTHDQLEPVPYKELKDEPK